MRADLGVRYAVPRPAAILPRAMPPLEARQAPKHVEAERQIHVAENCRRHQQTRHALRFFGA